MGAATTDTTLDLPREAGGRFKRGLRKPAVSGRKKGTPNSIPAEVRSMVLRALDKAGGVDYLVWAARKKPLGFLALLGRCIPSEVSVTAGQGWSGIVDAVNRAAQESRAALEPGAAAGASAVIDVPATVRTIAEGAESSPTPTSEGETPASEGAP